MRALLRSRRFLIGAAIVSLPLLFVAFSARAAVVLYDQPAGSGSNLAHISSTTSLTQVGQRVADDFVLGATATISDIH